MHAQKAGADFAVLINPYYPAASDEGLYRWFKQVCGSVDIGVWLFDTAYSGVSLSAGPDRAAGGHRERVRDQGRPGPRHVPGGAGRVGDQILVCEPHEGTWLENMRDHGQRVFMSSAAPYLYQTPGWQPMREYTALALGGDFAAAARSPPRWTRCARWRPSGCTARPRRTDALASIKAWAGAGRHVRRPGPAAAAAAHPGRAGRTRRRPGRGRAAYRAPGGQPG